jgi:hypothetical protein
MGVAIDEPRQDRAAHPSLRKVSQLPRALPGGAGKGDHTLPPGQGGVVNDLEPSHVLAPSRHDHSSSGDQRRGENQSVGHVVNALPAGAGRSGTAVRVPMQ